MTRTNQNSMAFVVEQFESRRLMSAGIVGAELQGSDDAGLAPKQGAGAGVNVALGDGSVRFVSSGITGAYSKQDQVMGLHFKLVAPRQ